MNRTDADQKVLRIAAAEEILAYVPHAMGYYPQDSLVVISLRPPRGRLGLVARMDLATMRGRDAGVCAQSLARHLRQDGAQRVFVVLYVAGEPGAARRDVVLRAAVRLLSRTLGMPPVAETWVVGTTGFVSLECTDPACCPDVGRPLELLSETAVAAEFVLNGSAPVSSRAGLAPGVDRARGRRGAFERERRASLVLIAESFAAVERPVASFLVEEVVALLQAGVHAPGRLGRVAAVLATRTLRDRALALFVSRAVHRELIDGDLEVFQRVLNAGAPTPDPALTGPARSVLVAAVRLARGATRTELLAVLAWLLWWCGDGAGAAVAVDEALEQDRGHRLAGLVRRTLDGGVGPGWVRPGSVEALG